MKTLFVHQPLVVDGVDGSDWQFELSTETISGYLKSKGDTQSVDEFIATYGALQADELISFAKESGANVDLKPIAANI